MKVITKVIAKRVHDYQTCRLLKDLPLYSNNMNGLKTVKLQKLNLNKKLIDFHLISLTKNILAKNFNTFRKLKILKFILEQITKIFLISHITKATRNRRYSQYIMCLLYVFISTW